MHSLIHAWSIESYLPEERLILTLVNFKIVCSPDIHPQKYSLVDSGWFNQMFLVYNKLNVHDDKWACHVTHFK